jgi:hypothetical protein
MSKRMIMADAIYKYNLAKGLALLAAGDLINSQHYFIRANLALDILQGF